MTRVPEKNPSPMACATFSPSGVQGHVNPSQDLPKLADDSKCLISLWEDKPLSLALLMEDSKG